MKIQNIIIGAVAVFALVFGIMSYNKVPEKVIGIAGERGVQGFQGERGASGSQGERGAQGLKGEKGDSGQVLGAVNSPNFISTWISVNGVKKEYRKTTSLTVATTTVCALQSPTYATSTLTFGGIKFDISSTTASKITLAKSATAFATTTKIGGRDIEANNQAAIIATTTPSTGNEDIIFAPGKWFVVGMAGATFTNGQYSPSGSCSAEFTVF